MNTTRKDFEKEMSKSAKKAGVPVKLYKYMLFSLLKKPTTICFGTPEEDEAAKQKAEADARKAEEEKNKVKTTYTKEEFDRHTAAQRRAHEAELKKQATELQKLSEDKRLTQEERDAHAKRLEEVEAQFKTQEQLANERVKKAEEKYKKESEDNKKAAETYKKKYHDTLIDNSLTTEAALAEERVPGQLKVFVKDKAVLVDELDAEGKSTGNQVVQIVLDDVDAEKKPIKLTLPVREAFKRMKEKPELYGNLFKGTGSGGTGANNGSGGGGSGGALPKDTASYMAARNAKK